MTSETCIKMGVSGSEKLKNLADTPKKNSKNLADTPGWAP